MIEEALPWWVYVPVLIGWMVWEWYRWGSRDD